MHSKVIHEKRLKCLAPSKRPRLYALSQVNRKGMHFGSYQMPWDWTHYKKENVWGNSYKKKQRFSTKSSITKHCTKKEEGVQMQVTSKLYIVPVDWLRASSNLQLHGSIFQQSDLVSHKKNNTTVIVPCKASK